MCPTAGDFVGTSGSTKLVPTAVFVGFSIGKIIFFTEKRAFSVEKSTFFSSELTLKQNVNSKNTN